MPKELCVFDTLADLVAIDVAKLYSLLWKVMNGTIIILFLSLKVAASINE